MQKGYFLKPHKDKAFDAGSNIDKIILDDFTIDNLKKIGMIWGFLKYYHPNVAKGDYNMDYELFRVLPNVLDSKNAGERDQILVTWINTFGDFKEGNYDLDDLEGVKLKPDLDWIEESSFSEELTKKLLLVKDAKRIRKNYYVELFPVGSPKFKNENPYETMKFPDTGFRLLAVYRFWNMVQYFFPYRYLIDQDWEETLEEFIPAIISTDSELSYTLTLQDLIGRIQDTHAYIGRRNAALNKFLGDRYAPLEMTFIENKAVITDFHDETETVKIPSNLEIGDVITHINNQSLESIVTERLKLNPASNFPTQLRNISTNLLRTNDKTVEIDFLRNGIADKLALKTYTSDSIKIKNNYQKNDTSFYLEEPGIGYIYPGSLRNKELPAIWDSFRNTKGLIVDLRCFPSEFNAFSLSKYLVPQKTVFVHYTQGNVQNPGLFTFENTAFLGKENENSYKGKVVILVNERTQSSVEFTAMALQASPNATVVGSTTAGANGNVALIDLPGKIETAFSGIGVYYPNGRETQRIGIVPDIEVKPTISGIRSGRDEVLEKAVGFINGEGR